MAAGAVEFAILRDNVGPAVRSRGQTLVIFIILTTRTHAHGNENQYGCCGTTGYF